MTDAGDGATPAWPTELKVTDKGRVLNVAFEDGRSFALTAEYLRVMSPSAEVKGHSRKERKIVGGKRDVAIVGVDPIGTYAVRLSFDDMHSTGLYTWGYLDELGTLKADKWTAYLAELAAAGLDRDRTGERTAGDH